MAESDKPHDPGMEELQLNIWRRPPKDGRPEQMAISVRVGSELVHESGWKDGRYYVIEYQRAMQKIGEFHTRSGFRPSVAVPAP